MRQSISVFNPAKIINQLPLAVLKTFKKGDCIYQEKDAAYYIYKIKSGLVLLGNGLQEEGSAFSHLMTSGEFFGEEPLMNQSERSNGALVLSEILEVEVFRPQQLMEEVQISGILNTNYSMVIKRMQQTLLRNTTMQLQQRIKSVLLHISELAGVNLLNGERLIRMKLKHRELAVLCNASRQSITTQLQELVQNDYIKIDRNSVLLTQKLIVNQ